MKINFPWFTLYAEPNGHRVRCYLAMILHELLHLLGIDPHNEGSFGYSQSIRYSIGIPSTNLSPGLAGSNLFAIYGEELPPVIDGVYLYLFDNVSGNSPYGALHEIYRGNAGVGWELLFTASTGELSPVFSSNSTSFDGIEFIYQDGIDVSPPSGSLFQHWDALTVVDSIKFTQFSIQIFWEESPGGDPGEILLNWPAIITHAYGEGYSIFGDEIYMCKGTLGGDSLIGFVQLNDEPLFALTPVSGTSQPAIEAGDTIVFSGQAMINVPEPDPES